MTRFRPTKTINTVLIAGRLSKINGFLSGANPAGLNRSQQLKTAKEFQLTNSAVTAEEKIIRSKDWKK